MEGLWTDWSALWEEPEERSQKTLNQLHLCARELKWPEKTNGDTWKERTESTEELQKRVLPLIDRGLWVFVK